MNPEDALLDWLITYLEADSTLQGMCEGDSDGFVAPDVRWGTLASPFVRVDRLDGHDLMVVGMARVWVDTTWHIRGCLHWRGTGRPDRTDVDQIGGRLDTLLHAHNANTGTYEIESFREEAEPVPSVLEQNGEVWLYSGGVYRLRIAAV